MNGFFSLLHRAQSVCADVENTDGIYFTFHSGTFIICLKIDNIISQSTSVCHIRLGFQVIKESF